MYLKTLQIFGFKSFADKTVLEFQPGVTAIVGPNGCGKSNVSDAIRWVLGEQSAKALRGDEMADVIFNGTDLRKPFGMAEVSLTFGDCKEVLHTGAIAGIDVNFDEVTITRRVARDGSSDYLLNKVPCRLRDIQALFMGTGVGRAAYSIMEQGKIDRVISAHPEDRRAVFDEAAGITKFKAQKREALRKLELTEDNRAKVAIQIQEVRRQINSLQRQASKARRYQRLLNEMRLLDTQLGRHELEEIISAIAAIEKENAELKQKMESLRGEADRKEAHVQELRGQWNAAEERRQGVLQKQRDLQSEIERHETQIRVNSDRISETESAVQAADQAASEARARLAEIQGRRGGVQEELAGYDQRLAGQQAELAQAQAALEESVAAERRHGEAIQQLQSALLEVEGRLASLRNQVATLEQQLQEFQRRSEKLGADRTAAGEEREKLAHRLDSLRAETDSFKQTFEACRHAITGGEDALREAEGQCQSLGARIAEEQRILSEKTSRRDLLKQLQDSYEGYSSGAQALLREQGPAGAVLGTLANLIEVDPQFAPAIEAGLGHRLQAIVVQEPGQALDLVQQLRSKELGRAWFALRVEEPAPAAREALLGSLGWAIDRVRPQAAVEPLVRRLCANLALVQDLAQAMELRKYHPAVTFVTLDGDVLDKDGVLSAGSVKALPVPLIGRRNEIASLDAEIALCEARLREHSVSKGEWEGRRSLARQSLGDQQTALRTHETDLTRKEGTLLALQGEVQDKDERLAAIELELQELQKRRSQGESDLARFRGELSEAEARRSAAHQEMEQARQRSEQLASERHQRGERANQVRVACATLEQQLHTLRSQLESLDARARETESFIASRDAEAQAGRQRVVQWQGESASATRQIEGLREIASGIAGQVAEIDREKADLDARIQAAIQEAHACRARMDEMQEALRDHDIRLTEKRGDASHLADRIQREYQVDIQTLTLIPLQPADQAQAEAPAPAAEADAPAPEAVAEAPAEGEPESEARTRLRKIDLENLQFLPFSDWDEVAMHVNEVRSRIQSIGPVNTEAIQEYEALEERFKFLEQQHNDLVTSKDNLLSILQKLNVESRRMFTETLEKIRQNFQAIYTELFGGGHADLMLTDEADPLECGIDIVAKPPGKQLQRIQLLSGGEKAMTAVALLFSIYMVKPSPFCVLDEVDAPWDESNIKRFTQMLERFLAHSQFVIITHNKRTIGMADALYGVTMEERGVSKLVTVKFHKKNSEATRQAGAEAAAAEEAQAIELAPARAAKEEEAPAIEESLSRPRRGRRSIAPAPAPETM